MLFHRRILALACLLPGLASEAPAQFDAYDWTLVFPDAGTFSVIGDEMHFDCAPIGFGYCDTHYESTAPQAGTFIVDVTAQAVSFVGGLGAFTYRNGVQTMICTTCTTTASLDVEAGDSFGFGMNANDFLFATATFSHLVFVPRPGPPLSRWPTRPGCSRRSTARARD